MRVASGGGARFTSPRFDARRETQNVPSGRVGGEPLIRTRQADGAPFLRAVWLMRRPPE